MPNVEISAVVFQEEDWLVAQCLQYDIAAQAKSLNDLQYELERSLVAHIVLNTDAELVPFDALPPAPQIYWEMFEQGLRLETEKRPFRMPAGMPLPIPDMKIADRVAF